MQTSEESYPRPDFQRDDLQWRSLDGDWDFAFDNEDAGVSEAWHSNGLPNKLKRNIKVPFVFQTPASGINNQDAHEVIWYEKAVSSPWFPDQTNRADKLLLRFGAVDYEATVWVNGQYVGFHRGGHVPFDIDVTGESQIKHSGTATGGSMRITVRVRDSPHDLTQPRGKQYWKPQPESIFYTPSSGIWQSVWLEAVPQVRLADSSGGTVLRSNDIETGQLHADVALIGKKAGETYSIEIEASFAGYPVNKSGHSVGPEKNRVQIDVALALSRLQFDVLPPSVPKDSVCWSKTLALWSPEHPFLYDLVIELYCDGTKLDSVKTTTGMRSLSWATGDSTFRLNGQPYFHALVLDQGYWPDTLMTPPSTAALKHDIELSKAMGFNGCRKHQKVEDPRFLYWADKLGFMVWGEMASAYEFDASYTPRFDEEWRAMVLRDVNHPSVVAWTPANESWGYGKLCEDSPKAVAQRHHLRSIYHTTKTIDATRPINDNCGWEHVATDLTTFHDYADAPQLSELCASLDSLFTKKGGPPLFVPATPSDPGASHAPGAPVLCTEFGGVNIKPGAGAGERDWGYTTASDAEDLLQRVERLCTAVVAGGVCCGLVYTQLTDIEQEVNGLYTYDRKPKLDPERVKGIMERCRRMYFEKLGEAR